MVDSTNRREVSEMRLVVGTNARLAEFARQRLTLTLLVVLPPLVIELYGVAIASFPALPGAGETPETVGRITGTLFAVAFLAGLIGLFQVLSARDGDERLTLCGYPRHTLLVTRLVTLLAVAGAGTTVAFAVLVWRVDVAAPGLAFVVLLLAGVLYGLIGIVVGTILPKELEGSLILVFLADLDNALSSGLFDVGPLATIAPLHHPHELLRAAVLDGTLGDGHLLPAIGSLLVVCLLAVGTYTDVTGVGGSIR
jgi:hypothetical protein